MFTIINDPKLSESQKCQALQESFKKDPFGPQIHDLSGKTALHHAVSNNLPEVVKLLLKLGAPVNALDYDRQSPLHYAAASGFDKLIWILGYFPGCKFNLLDVFNETALHKAIDSRNPQCVKSLLLVSEFSIDKTIKNLTGYTAGDLIRLISNLKSQADMAKAFTIQPDLFGRTPLHLAIINDLSDLVQMHLDAGADINKPDQNGEVALHFAARLGYDHILLYLCYQENINMDKPDSNGNTALHKSIEASHPGCVKTLVTAQKPASRTVKNSNGKIPAELIPLKNKDLAIALKNALKSMQIANLLTEQYEKELFTTATDSTTSYRTYLHKHFKELDQPINEMISPRFFSDTAPSNPPHKRRHTFGRQQKEQKNSIESLELKSPLEQATEQPQPSHKKAKYSLENAFEKNDVHAVVKQIKKANKKKLLHEFHAKFSVFIASHQSEAAGHFLQAVVHELQAQLIFEQDSYEDLCSVAENSLPKLLLSEGLKKSCRIQEINHISGEALRVLSTVEVIQNHLKALVKICSGDIVDNDIHIDLNKVQIDAIGLLDFVDPHEIIALLIKLNPLFSNIQRLQSHFIVFTLINPQSLYGYDFSASLLAKEINLYLTTCCPQNIATVISKHNKLIAEYKTTSLHSFVEQLKPIIVKLSNPPKIDIRSKIDEFVTQNSVSLKRNKPSAVLVSFIAREFNVLNARFYQNCMLKEFRNKCWEPKDDLNTHPTLIEQSNQFYLTKKFIIKLILSYPTDLQKAHALTLFILVARESFHYQYGSDLTTIVAISAALQSTKVSHLKGARILLDSHTLRIQDALIRFTDPMNNFKLYRGLLAADVKALPLLAVFYADKIHIYENSPEANTESLGKACQSLITLKKGLANIPLNSQSNLLQQLHLPKEIPQISIEPAKNIPEERKSLKAKSESYNMRKTKRLSIFGGSSTITTEHPIVPVVPATQSTLSLTSDNSSISGADAHQPNKTL